MSVLEKIKEHLGDKILEETRSSAVHSFISISPENLYETNKFMYEILGGRLATATGMDSMDALEILYHFCFDSEHMVITIKTKTDKAHPVVPSITPYLPGAEWIEREMHDLLGIGFENHPNLKRLILSDDWPEGDYPLRKDRKK